jgi:hypothetical protein
MLRLPKGGSGGALVSKIGGVAMSRTISVGVLGPSRWSFMAAVLADRISLTLETKTSQQIPKAVLREAKDFIKLALEGSGDAPSNNPPASINAYAIAVGAAVPQPSAAPETRESLRARFQGFSELLDKLPESGAFDENQQGVAADLVSFLTKLRIDGQVQAYEQAVRWDPSSPSR